MVASGTTLAEMEEELEERKAEMSMTEKHEGAAMSTTTAEQTAEMALETNAVSVVSGKKRDEHKQTPEPDAKSSQPEFFEFSDTEPEQHKDENFSNVPSVEVSFNPALSNQLVSKGEYTETRNSEMIEPDKDEKDNIAGAIEVTSNETMKPTDHKQADTATEGEMVQEFSKGSPTQNSEEE